MRLNPGVKPTVLQPRNSENKENAEIVVCNIVHGQDKENAEVVVHNIDHGKDKENAEK